MRTQGDQRHRLLELVDAYQAGEPLAERAVANLIVILSEEDCCFWRQMRTPFTPGLVVKWKIFALKCEPFCQAARKVGQWVVREGCVIAFGFAGQQHVERFVEVIALLRVEILCTAS